MKHFVQGNPSRWNGGRVIETKFLGHFTFFFSFHIFLFISVRDKHKCFCNVLTNYYYYFYAGSVIAVSKVQLFLNKEEYGAKNLRLSEVLHWVHKQIVTMDDAFNYNTHANTTWICFDTIWKLSTVINLSYITLVNL